jgi:hypothetical protein
VGAPRSALEHLEADAQDVNKATRQCGDVVVGAVATAMAPIAEQFLARLQRAKDEVLILEQIFHALTEGDGEQVLLPSGQFARLEDPRMKPVAGARQRFFQLKADHVRAQEAAIVWRRWRESLRRDPDAALPEVPA